jgi:hypothetical protein
MQNSLQVCNSIHAQVKQLDEIIVNCNGLSLSILICVAAVTNIQLNNLKKFVHARILLGQIFGFHYFEAASRFILGPDSWDLLLESDYLNSVFMR